VYPLLARVTCGSTISWIDVKLPHRLAAGLLECSADLRVNLLDERSDCAGFLPVGFNLIFDLRLESQRLLLHVLELRRMLLEVLARLRHAPEPLQPLHLLEQGIPQRGLAVRLLLPQWPTDSRTARVARPSHPATEFIKPRRVRSNPPAACPGFLQALTSMAARQRA